MVCRHWSSSQGRPRPSSAHETTEHLPTRRPFWWADSLDRLALRLAFAHLLSWESWNHRTAGERRRVQERVDAHKTEIDGFGDLIEDLRGIRSGAA